MCDYSKKSGYFMKMSINFMDIENENEFILKEKTVVNGRKNVGTKLNCNLVRTCLLKKTKHDDFR